MVRRSVQVCLHHPNRKDLRIDHSHAVCRCRLAGGEQHTIGVGHSADEDLQVFGLLGGVPLRAGGEGLRPGLNLGGGVQWLTIKNRTNP